MTEHATVVDLSLKLSHRILRLAEESRDPFAKRVKLALEEFANYKALPNHFNWKYLPDSSFVKIAQQSTSIYEVNRTLLSHLVRVVEAFEVISVWRAADLVATAVESLNRDRTISASAVSRSLIELAVTYLEAHNVLRASFAEFPWDKMQLGALNLEERSPEGKKIGIESYIEKLISGTRLEKALELNPDLEKKNILSVMTKADKKLAKQNAGFEILPNYKFLCELAHPNAVGFERYCERQDLRHDGWLNRRLTKTAHGDPERIIVERCLWAITFGCETMMASFAEYQNLMRFFAEKIGKPLPY
jgi:hypothetical protein